MDKQVYIARFKNGLKGPTKVFAFDEADARKKAFAAFLFHSSMRNPNWKIDDVVYSIEPDPSQTMGGPGIQPETQKRCAAVGSELAVPERKESR